MASSVSEEKKSEDEDVMIPMLTVGVLGGGQLGRMMAWAAHRLGVKLVALDGGGENPRGGKRRTTRWRKFQRSKKHSRAIGYVRYPDR